MATRKSTTEVLNEEQIEQTVYFSNSICTIGSKTWEFNGYDKDGEGTEASIVFPVRNIAAIGLHKTYPNAWKLAALSAIAALISFSFLDSPFGITLLILGILGVVCAVIMMRKKSLMVNTNNPDCKYTFEGVSTRTAIRKYMIPMRQCLLENA